MKRKNLFANLLIMAIMVLFSSSNLMAQGGGGQRQGQGPGKMDAETATKAMVTKLDTALDLTSDQESEVSAVYLAIAEDNSESFETKMKEMMEARKNNSSERPAEGEKPKMPNMFAQTGSAATATETKMKKILSDDQYTKWKEMDTLAELTEMERPSGNRGGGGGRK